MRFISKEGACERLHEIHSSPSGVCEVFGLNNLVRQFGLRFHCNGIKQLPRDFLKACPAYQDMLPFPPFPFHYALSAPTAHMNGYRLILLIWHLERSGHRKWSLFMTNNRGQSPSRTLFGTPYVRGKQFSLHRSG